MNVRIVVADESEASFFDLQSAGAPLQLASKIEDPTARLHDRDLESDRPGRSFDSTSAHRHAMDGERSSHRHHQEEFARRIAEVIEGGRQHQEFDRLVIMAGPRMLGLIREALPEANRTFIAAEIPKDLVHLDEEIIKTYLPRKIFSRVGSTTGS